MNTRTLKVIAINLLVFATLLALVEIVLQGLALARPSYEVLFLQPDRKLGWKQVPNLRWQWAGHHWYAADFSVPIATNPLGFRDSVREAGKPDGVRRVALLGDSFIEAVQVPFEATAGQRLEQILNADRRDSQPRWEVLNFGISNFGIGQYALTWDQYASQYSPDYVTIFVAGLHMKRTVTKYEHGAFSRQASLSVRPTFRLQDGKLVEEPALDYEAFVAAQNRLVANEFDGARARRRMQLITPYLYREFRNGLSAAIRPRASPSPGTADPISQDMLEVNLEIIRDLGRKVSVAGGKLIVLDATRFFGNDEALSSTLRAWCEKHDLGYVPVYAGLLSASQSGTPTRWAHDSHLNVAGNEILASEVATWIAQH
jgi:hypothetical protein